MMPESLRAQPLLRQWLAVLPDGRVQAFSGKVDIGQGISAAFREANAAGGIANGRPFILQQADYTRDPNAAMATLSDRC